MSKEVSSDEHEWHHWCGASTCKGVISRQIAIIVLWNHFDANALVTQNLNFINLTTAVRTTLRDESCSKLRESSVRPAPNCIWSHSLNASLSLNWKYLNQVYSPLQFRQHHAFRLEVYLIKAGILQLLRRIWITVEGRYADVPLNNVCRWSDASMQQLIA